MITKKQILVSVIISTIVALLYLCFVSVKISNNTENKYPSPVCYIPEGCPDMGSSSNYGYPFVFRHYTNGIAGPQIETYYDKAFLNFLIYFFILFIPLAILFSVRSYIKKK